MVSCVLLKSRETKDQDPNTVKLILYQDVVIYLWNWGLEGERIWVFVSNCLKQWYPSPWCPQQSFLGMMWQYWSHIVAEWSDPFLRCEFAELCTEMMIQLPITTGGSVSWFLSGIDSPSLQIHNVKKKWVALHQKGKASMPPGHAQMQFWVHWI